MGILLLVALGPVLAIATAWALSDGARITGTDRPIRLILLLVALGPVLAIATAWALSDGARITGTDRPIRLILLIDLCYVLVLGALIAWRRR